MPEDLSTQEDLTVIAVDAMGGDDAPHVVLEGVANAMGDDPGIGIILCGPEEIVEPFAANYDRCEARVTTQTIEMAEHPTTAVRKKRDSSIVVGCHLVKEGKAHGFFSAGSSGACLSAATLVMGRIKGVARPALTTLLPSPVQPVVMCDVGANSDCKPEYLVQFAQMATIYAEKIVRIKDPSVGLLNIGEEETKGSRFALEAHELLKKYVPNFKGNAEGRDVLTGDFDIVVTDGFTGNVCLKTMEGTAKVLFKALRENLMSSTVSKLGAMAIRGNIRGLLDHISPDNRGGAPLLGVKGACIVGHGSSNSTAIKNGILTTVDIVRFGLNNLIEKAVAETAEKAKAE